MAEAEDGRRVKMTKLLLKKSIIELMKSKSINNISIKEICSGADVNRSTFYRHYSDQYDLYNEITKETFQKSITTFITTREESGDFKIALEAVLTELLEEREVVLIILSDKGNAKIGESFIGMASSIEFENFDSELITYIIQFIAAGFTSIIWSWLNKPDRRSAGEVAEIINNIIKHGVYKTVIADFNLMKNKDDN